MSFTYFNPEGPVTSIAASTVAPTAVQISSSTGVPCSNVLLQNTNATVDAMIGWGGTTLEAAANVASISSPNQYYLPAANQVVVVARPDGFFTGTTTTISATIRIQPGTA